MSFFLWDLRPYLRQTAGQMVLGSIAGIVMNTAVVAGPIALGRAIDQVNGLAAGIASATDVYLACMVYLGAVALMEIPRILKRWWLMTANARIRANIRVDAFRGSIAWPMERLARTPIGDLMARIVADVDVLGVGIREATIEIWDTVLFSLSLVVAMLVIDVRLSLMALAPVPVAMLLAHATGRWVSIRTTAARIANAVLTAVLQEQLANIRVVKLYGQQAPAVRRATERSRTLADRNLSVARLVGALKPTYTSIMTSGVILIVWQGGERVVEGTLTIGGFIAYLDLYQRFVNRAFRMPQLVNSLQSASSAYARLKPLLAPPTPVIGEPRRASFDPLHVAGSAWPEASIGRGHGGATRVELRDLRMRYPGGTATVVNGIDLDIPAGTFVGVTGPVGSGKSALLRALTGVFPLDGGSITLDGRPIDSLSAAERAATIGYLPQDPSLFSGALRDNVLLFDGRADRWNPALRRAYDASALQTDIDGFAAGDETQIGELGVRVSGGQRQRIGLARAMQPSLDHRPGLLLLDDPFSAVDLATERHILMALREAFGPSAPPEHRATVVLCSHRLASFRVLDRVLVIDGGRIVESGDFEEMIAGGGTFARMYRAQAVLAESGSLGAVAR